MRYFVIVRRVLALFHFDYNQGSPLVFVGLPIAQMSKDLHQDLYFEDLDNIWTIVQDILLQMSFLIDNIPVRVFFRFDLTNNQKFGNQVFDECENIKKKLSWRCFLTSLSLFSSNFKMDSFIFSVFDTTRFLTIAESGEFLNTLLELFFRTWLY